MALAAQCSGLLPEKSVSVAAFGHIDNKYSTSRVWARPAALCKAVNPFISLPERTIFGIGGAVFNLRNSKSLSTAAE